MNKRRISIIGAVVVLIAAVVVVGLAIKKDREYVDLVKVTNFDECVKAGYDVMESDPRQCRTKDGQTFTEEKPEPSPEPTDEAPSTEHASEQGVVVSVDSPLEGDTVSSPLQITGSVPGSWSFEASFGIEILDENGTKIADGFATLEGDWMTEDMVPFSASIDFDAPPTDTGTLVLQKANPSDEGSGADEVHIAIRFK